MKKLALLLTLAGLTFSGCAIKTEYNLPNEDKVVDKTNNFLNLRKVTITKSNGRVIEYFDTDNNTKLDYVKITKDKKTKLYDQLEFLAEAQKIFDEYNNNFIIEMRKEEIQKAIQDLK